MAGIDTETVLVGLDIGTSSVKGLMIDAAGERLAAYSESYPSTRPFAGAVEQDPAIWMRHVDAALDLFASHSRAGEVAAIGITSQVNTHVPCDAAGIPLRPAITWQDTRASAQAALLDAAIGAEAKIAALGAPIPIDASHALSRMAWFAQQEPEIWRATAHLLLPKDVVIAALTGNVVADPIAAVGLVGTDHTYADDILTLVPRATEILPPLRDPLDIGGHVLSGRPFAGKPVAVGTMDAWAGMFGLGVATEGAAFYLSGTSDVIGMISERGSGTAGIVTFPDWRGIRLHAGPTQSGGASLGWFARLLGHDIETLSSMAGEASITAESPLFLPHLEGERAPLWDATSRGAFCGMTGRTGPAELAASVMEGVAFSARMALEAIESSGARTIEGLSYGGGGSGSDVWGQIRANALNRRLHRVTTSEVGAVGASMMAGVASKTIGSLAEAAEAVVLFGKTFEPDHSQISLMNDRYTAYCNLYRALRPINEKLNL